MRRQSTLRSAETILIAFLLLAVLLAARAAASPIAFLEGDGTVSGTPFDAELKLHYAGPDLSRTLVQAALEIPPSSLTLNEYGYYNVRVSGEVLVDGRRYDRFRYRFDVADEGSDERPVLLGFERKLRPGEYELELVVEDLAAGRTYRTVRPLEVPTIAAPPPSGTVAEADAEMAPPPGATVEILAPERPILVGMQRFVARTRGDVDSVSFLLDGRRILTARRAPYTVELDLGERAEIHELRVEAFDAAGRRVASARRELNTGGQRFAVDLETGIVPRYPFDELYAEPTFELPEGRRVQRVELFLGDERLAVLDRPPFRHTFPRPDGEGHDDASLLRAVAHLDDGRVAQAVTVAGAEVEDVKVEMVELFPAIVDRKGRLVTSLSRGDLAIYENSIPQTIHRFERVDELPIHAGLLLDTSSSMEERLAGVATAAGRFLDTALRPADSAMLMTFAGHARTVVDFTDDRVLLANSLLGLEASGTTALYDSLLEALERFDGRQGGQRALLLLSDGQDEKSQAALRQVLEMARRTGVTIYTIGLDDYHYQSLDREVLHRLAVETGGRSYLIEDVDELAAVYAEIERDLRSRYLVAYQSTNSHDSRSFRVVDVQVTRPGLEARVARGYYP